MMGKIVGIGLVGLTQIAIWSIFSLVIFLWATDRFQKQWFGVELGPSMSAMIGAAIALMPRIGLLEWDDTDIPWHLLIFSAGA